LYTLKPSSANGRLLIWKLSAELVTEKPLTGHGYESFVTAYREKQINYFRDHPEDVQSGWVAGEPVFAFNDYLQLTVEYGIIALLLFLFVLYGLFSLRWSVIPDAGRELLCITKAAILSVMICMLFSYPLQNPSIVICFIVLLASVSGYDNRIILSLKFRKIVLFTGSVIVFVLLGYLAVHSAKSVVYGLKWKNAYAALEKEPGNSVKEYEKLFGFLRHDRSFLLNYGSVLYKAKDYRTCTVHFEKYGYLIMKTGMYVMTGEAYEKLGNIEKAEENYQKASWLVPHKFIPRYKLFKLYKTNGQPEKAKATALQIQKMKIKVFSEPVKRIKTEVNEYILSQHMQSNHE
jgi:tetratricopeptide (TPR) repeat protein